MTSVERPHTAARLDPAQWDTVIAPAGPRTSLNLKELWAYRELLYYLTWRNLKVRYKQTFLGAAWAILQPLLTMTVFTIFFGRLAGVPSDGIPYPIFAYSALVPWTYFANALAQSSQSLVENEAMLTKVYFPRLLLPLAPVVSNILDFAVAFFILILMMAAYGLPVTAALWTAPLFLALSAATAWGAGLWLSTLNVRYRDVRYVVPFLLQFWLFATPIAYPSSLLDERWRALYGLNPMVGVVEGFRWALLGHGPRPDVLLVPSLLVIAVLVTAGLIYFRRAEATFADEV